MKIRIIGTMEECAAARDYYSELEEQENVRSVTISREYPCRAVARSIGCMWRSGMTI